MYLSGNGDSNSNTNNILILFTYRIADKKSDKKRKAKKKRRAKRRAEKSRLYNSSQFENLGFSQSLNNAMNNSTVIFDDLNNVSINSFAVLNVSIDDTSRLHITNNSQHHKGYNQFLGVHPGQFHHNQGQTTLAGHGGLWLEQRAEPHPPAPAWSVPVTKSCPVLPNNTIYSPHLHNTSKELPNNVFIDVQNSPSQSCYGDKNMSKHNRGPSLGHSFESQEPQLAKASLTEEVPRKKSERKKKAKRVANDTVPEHQLVNRSDQIGNGDSKMQHGEKSSVGKSPSINSFLGKKKSNSGQDLLNCSDLTQASKSYSESEI